MLAGEGSIKVARVACLQGHVCIAHEETPHPHDLQNVGPPPPCGPPSPQGRGLEINITPLSPRERARNQYYPSLPKGEGWKSKSQPSPRGEGARRRRAGEGSFSTP